MERKKEELFIKAADAEQSVKPNLKNQIFASIASIEKIVSTISAISDKMQVRV